MALVQSLNRIAMQRNTVHAALEATYCIFKDNKGDAYLQIDTYGSPVRKIPGKKSQTIQFGPQAIEQLKQIFDKM